MAAVQDSHPSDSRDDQATAAGSKLKDIVDCIHSCFTHICYGSIHACYMAWRKVGGVYIFDRLYAIGFALAVGALLSDGQQYFDCGKSLRARPAYRIVVTAYRNSKHIVSDTSLNGVDHNVILAPSHQVLAGVAA
jgi:hypothetical protein